MTATSLKDCVKGGRSSWVALYLNHRRGIILSIALLISILVAFRSLPNSSGLSPQYPDAARHAMNGVFIYDLVRTGNISHPVRFGREYYSRFPAVSLPFHPPGFPLVEAGAYAVLGVSFTTARLTIALFAAAAVLAFFSLVAHTHGVFLAAVSSVTLFSLPTTRLLSSDVYLEIPALAPLFLSILFLGKFFANPTTAGTIAFGALASVAIWTKQQTIFVIAVPVIYVLWTRQWQMFAKWRFWALILIPTAAAGALVAISLGTVVSVPGSQLWAQMGVIRRLLVNFEFYRSILSFVAFLVVIGLIANRVSRVRACLTPLLRLDIILYASWALAACFLLMLLPATDVRYTIYLLPAVLVIGLSWIRHSLDLVFTRTLSYVLVAVSCALIAGYGFLSTPDVFLSGPLEAATLALRHTPRRILFCGSDNGAFIFAVRQLDPNLRTTVIRGDKLPMELFDPLAFDQFADRYGIDLILLQRGANDLAWRKLTEYPTPSMSRLAEIPFRNSKVSRSGSVIMYKHEIGSRRAQPEKRLRVPSYVSGRELDLTL